GAPAVRERRDAPEVVSALVVPARAGTRPPKLFLWRHAGTVLLATGSPLPRGRHVETYRASRKLPHMSQTWSFRGVVRSPIVPAAPATSEPGRREGVKPCHEYHQYGSTACWPERLRSRQW